MTASISPIHSTVPKVKEESSSDGLLSRLANFVMNFFKTIGKALFASLEFARTQLTHVKSWAYKNFDPSITVISITMVALVLNRLYV